MGFELIQPFIEAVFTLGILAVALALGPFVVVWVFDKFEDLADRIEASWNTKP